MGAEALECKTLKKKGRPRSKPLQQNPLTKNDQKQPMKPQQTRVPKSVVRLPEVKKEDCGPSAGEIKRPRRRPSIKANKQLQEQARKEQEGT